MINCTYKQEKIKRKEVTYMRKLINAIKKAFLENAEYLAKINMNLYR
jgi:hypothetical protein